MRFPPWLLAALLPGVVNPIFADAAVHGAISSNYVFRGFSLSGDRPAVSGGLDWQHASGAYAGTWLSSVELGAEVDVYTGFAGQLGRFGFDLGAASYDYTDDNFVDGAFQELYAGGQLGPLGLTLYRGRGPRHDLRYWYGELGTSVRAGRFVIELHYGISDRAFGPQTEDAAAALATTWRDLTLRATVTHENFADRTEFFVSVGKSWDVEKP